MDLIETYETFKTLYASKILHPHRYSTHFIALLTPNKVWQNWDHRALEILPRYLFHLDVIETQILNGDLLVHLTATGSRTLICVHRKLIRAGLTCPELYPLTAARLPCIPTAAEFETEDFR